MGSIPIRFRQCCRAPLFSESGIRNRISMPSKPKRPKKFSVPKETRRQARELLGSPKPTRVEQDTRRKPPKHKKRQVDDVLL